MIADYNNFQFKHDGALASRIACWNIFNNKKMDGTPGYYYGRVSGDLINNREIYPGVPEVSVDWALCFLDKEIIKSGITRGSLTVSKFIPYQLCPKCEGKGTFATMRDTFEIVLEASLCDVCDGKKIIPMHVS